MSNADTPARGDDAVGVPTRPDDGMLRRDSDGDVHLRGTARVGDDATAAACAQARRDDSKRTQLWMDVLGTQHSTLRYVHALDAQDAWARLRPLHQCEGGVRFKPGRNALDDALAPESGTAQAFAAWSCAAEDASAARASNIVLHARATGGVVSLHPDAARLNRAMASAPPAARAAWLRAWCASEAPYGAVGAVHSDVPQCAVLCFHNHTAYDNGWDAAVRDAVVRANVGTLAANGARLVQLPPSQWSTAGTLLHDYASKTGYTGAYTQHVADMLCSAVAAYAVPSVCFAVNTLPSGVQWASRDACPVPQLTRAALTSDVGGGRPPVVSFHTHAGRCTDWVFPSPLAWELATQRHVASKLPTSTWVNPVTYTDAARRVAWAARKACMWARVRVAGVAATPAAHQHLRLHASSQQRSDCLEVTWERSARRAHVVLDADTGAVSAALAPQPPSADVHARTSAQEVQRHALAHKYRLSLCGDGGDTHAAAALLSGSVVLVVDAPSSCVAPHVWDTRAFDGPYLRRTSPTSDVHEAHTVVRVHADLRNLVETVEWLQEHDAVAEAVAQRCQRRAELVFTESNMAWYCASVLQCIAS